MTDKLVTIATYSEPMMAHIAQAALEAEGIESYLADENIAGTYGLYSNIAGGVKLQVRESDSQRAQKLIQDKQSQDTEEPPEKNS